MWHSVRRHSSEQKMDKWILPSSLHWKRRDAKKVVCRSAVLLLCNTSRCWSSRLDPQLVRNAPEKGNGGFRSFTLIDQNRRAEGGGFWAPCTEVRAGRTPLECCKRFAHPFWWCMGSSIFHTLPKQTGYIHVKFVLLGQNPRGESPGGLVKTPSHFTQKQTAKTKRVRVRQATSSATYSYLVLLGSTYDGSYTPYQ